MADTKISALNSLSTPNTTDVLPIVDHTDLTQTKKVSYNDLSTALRTTLLSFQQPLTGSVNGNNKVYTWTYAPNVICVDGGIIQKTSSDGTSNWTGTTTTTFNIITPNFDIFSPC